MGERSERYPNYLCLNCFKRAVSIDGRPLSFSNVSVSGGYIAKYADTNEPYDSHDCYVDGIKCYADEAHMGGNVITLAKPAFAERLEGAVLGLLIGDALGVPYEFHDATSLPGFAEIEFEPPSYFRRSHISVPTGTWSDDGAQALILLNSLLECGKFDGRHFADGLVHWYDEGFMAIGKNVFDVGIQTANAIRELKNGAPPNLSGGVDEHSNGNGSLMRVLPLAIWHQGTDSELVSDAFAQSAVTHGHLRSQLCCAMYCLWVRRIIEQKYMPWDSALVTLSEIFPVGTLENVEFETRVLPRNGVYEISGSGYVVNSLRAAHWANNHGPYETVVKAAISLGEDTDTTACIAGGIAGIRFGVHAIPRRWREALRGKEIYQPLIEKLLSRFSSD